jgi:hypothetical protein
MKYLDFTTLFDSEPASLAIMSTFQLDADFFERRLLRCQTLNKARRIIIFMDAWQWAAMLREDVAAHSLNRRYLIVPVRPRYGVFHPKLNILISEQYGQVQCGSNNLTRAGCTSNLELLNSLRVNSEIESEEAIRISQDALSFFKRACDDAEEQAGRIARKWIEETLKSTPWLASASLTSKSSRVQLFHTYQGSLWDRLCGVLNADPPNRILVISPFYDLDAEMVHRLHRRWPRCRIELVVQQKTTNLPILKIKGLKSYVTLSELKNSSRRLHAKLVAWQSHKGSGCLVGSANFTSAAFDAKNVEACLLLDNSKEDVAKIFDGQLVKKPIAFSDFDPGADREQESVQSDSSTLRLDSALLNSDGELLVKYWHRLVPRPKSLRIALRTPGELRPRAIFDISNNEKGIECLLLTDSCLSDVHGVLLASLVVEVKDGREESNPVWVIQEERLTYEANWTGNSSVESKIVETGGGLIEYVDELLKSNGIEATIECLRRLIIRFNDGSDNTFGQRRFRLRVHDPYQPDNAPEWLDKYQANTTSLAEAIYEFVDRHEQKRLRRHAKRGNINGAENYLDILISLVRILYIFYERGIVLREQLIGRLTNYLLITMTGIDTSEDYSEGYLSCVSENLHGDSNYLQVVCNELNLLGHLWAVLIIAQRVRFVPNERAKDWISPTRPSDCLPQIREKLRNRLKELKLRKPSQEQVRKAIEDYNMFSSKQLTEIECEMEI